MSASTSTMRVPATMVSSPSTRGREDTQALNETEAAAVRIDRGPSWDKEPHTPAPLVDHSHATRWTTIAPRYGEFSVDSVSWWDEYRRDSFHSLVSMPLWVLLVGYLLVYTVFILLLALIFFIFAYADEPGEPSIVPSASWTNCVQCAWQSLTTVGYGSVSPVGFWSSLFCATATVLSLVFDAVGIGVFYQKLSHAARKSRTLLQCAGTTAPRSERRTPAHPAAAF
jgi:hypothetical protein